MRAGFPIHKKGGAVFALKAELLEHIARMEKKDA